MRNLFNVKCVMFNVILLYTLHFTHYTAFAQPVSARELIENAQAYDGKTIAYAGEVIGDIMRRGNFAWINVTDGEKAIGVWLEGHLLKQADLLAGSYRSTGDLIEVIGVFHRACPEHGGDLDIHAFEIEKIAPGRHNPEASSFNTGKRNAAVVLLGALGLIWILAQLKFK
ncbi:MAG: DNA-binding protein [Candidatus Omnitrophica bacterium]|nr:DNA-binding protein [Candidatus Omnitrophota bacterium]